MTSSVPQTTCPSHALAARHRPRVVSSSSAWSEAAKGSVLWDVGARTGVSAQSGVSPPMIAGQIIAVTTPGSQGTS